MVVAGRLHDYTGLTVQALDHFCQVDQFIVGVTYFKRFDHRFLTGTHDCNHALAFGNIDANGVHCHSSNTTIVQPESIFFSLPIQSIE